MNRIKFRSSNVTQITIRRVLMIPDYKQILQCLNEAERELFRVADDAECQRFHKNSQLSAVLSTACRIYHSRSAGALTISRIRTLCPQGNCATTCCTNCWSG